jgi:spore germination protein GerM
MALAGLVAVVGCGVEPEDGATRLADTEVPFDLLDSSPTTAPPPDPAAEVAALYFVDGDRLEPVFREVPEEATPEDVLLALADGPTTAEARRGLTSAFPDSTSILGVTVNRGVATVDLGSSAVAVRSDDQPLSVAQMVFTLTARPGIGRVAFTISGEPIDVPDGSGALTGDAVAREDYAALAPPTP